MKPWDYAALVGSFLIIVWFVRMMMKGDPERADEDEARNFFDEHGHWPDEDESLGGWTPRARRPDADSEPGFSAAQAAQRPDQRQGDQAEADAER